MKTEHLILMCAVRYALGRQSYIVGVVADYVASIKDKLPQGCVDLIIRDIEEEIKYYHKNGRTCGMKCDENAWRNLLEILKESRND